MKKTKKSLEEQLFGGSLKRTRKTKSKAPKMKWISLSDGTSVIRREEQKPPSEAQAKQRMQWTMIVHFAAVIKEALNFSSYALRNMNSVNYFVKTMFSDCIKGNYPDYMLDYNRMVISNGRISPLLLPCLTITAQGMGKLEWLSSSEDNLTENDELYILLYNETNDTICFLQDVQIPKTPKIMFNQPFTDKHDKLHCWVYGKKRYPAASSNSVYVEIVYED